MKELQKILPEFPRTQHLPYKPNVSAGDIICKDENVNYIFNADANVFVEEKLDGANCGMSLYKGNAVIRNRNHILKKGYKKDTAAKAQFLPVWGWFYENKEKFQKLEEQYPDLSVYGEWVYALHGIRYDKLPALFIAYDLYDYQSGFFLEPLLARRLLIESRFSVPPLLHMGKVSDWEQLEVLCNQPSDFSKSDLREGIYLKTSNSKFVTGRYKMIRSGYVQGYNWDAKVITRNTLVK